jgi:hypothetical protein
MEPGEEVIGLHALCFVPGLLDVTLERLLDSPGLDLGSLRFR